MWKTGTADTGSAVIKKVHKNFQKKDKEYQMVKQRVKWTWKISKGESEPVSKRETDGIMINKNNETTTLLKKARND